MDHPLESIALDGGWLCLDFINTVSVRRPELGTEYLNSWDDFRVWVCRVELFRGKELDQWAQLPESNIEELRTLRESLYQLFEYFTRNNQLHPQHLETFNGFLHEVYPHTQLCLQDGRLQRGIESAPHPEKPLWLIVLSAESLLLSDRLSRVKSCDNCGWLFLDTSKNNTRRWCNMQTCGSQIKAKAYYHRKKGGEI